MITSQQILIFVLSLFPLFMIAHWYDKTKHHSAVAKGSIGTALFGTLGAFLSAPLSAPFVLIGVALFGVAHYDRAKIGQ